MQILKMVSEAVYEEKKTEVQIEVESEYVPQDPELDSEQLSWTVDCVRASYRQDSKLRFVLRDIAHDIVTLSSSHLHGTDNPTNMSLGQLLMDAALIPG